MLLPTKKTGPKTVSLQNGNLFNQNLGATVQYRLPKKIRNVQRKSYQIWNPKTSSLGYFLKKDLQNPPPPLKSCQKIVTKDERCFETIKNTKKTSF